MARVTNRIKNNPTCSVIQGSECPYCSGTGWRFIGENTATECECMINKHKESVFRRSGFTRKKEHPLLKRSIEYVVKYKELCRRGTNWLYISGPTGSGKTVQACEIATSLIFGPCSVVGKFIDCTEFYLNVTCNYYQPDFQIEVAKLCGIELLVFDDFLKGITKSDTNVFRAFERILWDRSRRKKATIFTSEWTLNDVSDMDPALAGRIFEMTGGTGFSMAPVNYRLDKGVKKSFV